MTDETIRPALTPEEWARFHGDLSVDGSGVLHWGERVSWSGEDPIAIPVETTAGEVRHHALAALALYGQPFGFTREDVEVLKDIARDIWLGEEHANPASLDEMRDDALRIAAKIAALLPPA